MRHLDKPADQSAGGQATMKDRFIHIDKRWSEPRFWHAIVKNGSAYSAYYLLASVDLKRNASGDIVHVPEGSSAFRAIYGRTFLISIVVTLLTLLLGYPLAYWISRLPNRKANLVMICVLIPFWTSILVRIAAWIVLLQRQGLGNKARIDLGVTSPPFPLLDSEDRRVGKECVITCRSRWGPIH